MAFSIAPLEELLDSCQVVSIPLRHPFRGLTHRVVMLLAGPEGPGEWAAFVDYDDSTASHWLAAALEQAFDATLPGIPSDITRVRVNATFPALDASAVPAWWRRFPGVKSAKVKVGEPGQLLIDDVVRVAAIRKAIGPDATVRLDANGRWSVAEADKALFMLRGFDIDYVEQPVSSVQDMLRLRQRLSGSGIRLAADESMRDPDSRAEVLQAQAADVAVLKVGPLGGVKKTLQVAREAHASGWDVVISSGLETSVGLCHGALAAAVLQTEGIATAAAGLGTSVFFETDTTTEPLKVTGGTIPVSEPVLDPRKLKKVTADPERTKWWQDRLARCLPLARDLLEA